MKKTLSFVAVAAMLLSSCSKDTTEILAPESSDLGVFSASIELDGAPSTRLHIDKNDAGKWIYVWDGGDGVGVSSAVALDANVPAYTLSETTDPQFSVSENDTRYFGGWNDEGTALYAYYPYNPNGGVLEPKVGGDGVVANLKISEKQRYEFESFYKNTVSAVGYVDKYVLGESHFKMNVPFSILRFSVRGFGETQALTLKILKPGSTTDYYDLAGAAKVEIPTDEEVKPAFTLTEGAAGNSEQIVLTFGSKAEGFEYEGNDLVTFVVPAGIDLLNATIVLYNGELTPLNAETLDKETLKLDFVSSKAENGQYLTKPGAYIAFGSYPFNFGMDGKFVIEDDVTEKSVTADVEDLLSMTAEEKFLLYAYATQITAGDNPDSSDGNDGSAHDNIAQLIAASNAKGMKLESQMTAWIKADYIGDGALDFLGYNKEWAVKQYDNIQQALTNYAAELEAEDEAYLVAIQKFYKWYADNDNAINTIAFNGFEADKQVTIKNLKVNGNGLVGKAKSSLPNTDPNYWESVATLKNLKFENCTVNGNAFLAYNSNDVLNSFDHVVIGAGNKVIGVDGSYVGGLFSAAYASQLATIVSANGVIVDVLPVVDSASENKGQIVGLLQPVANYEVNLSDYKVTSLATPVYGVINGTYAVIVDTTGVDTTTAPDNASNAGVVGNLLGTPSIIVGGTAYWNGATAASVNEDGVLTAEELAYVLISKNNATIELALNYDMQGGELNLEGYDQNPNPMVISGAKTISNLTVNTHKNSWHASLFGKTANLTGLTLKNITVNVVKQSSGEYTTVAGLAQTGTATNVTVDGLTVNLADGVEVVNGIIGGLFSAVAPANLNSVTAKNVTLNALESIKTAGIVAGKLNLDTGDAWILSGITVSGAKYTGLGEMTLANKASLKTVDAYKVNSGHIGDYAYDDVPFGVINVAAAAWGVAGTPKVQTLTGENCSYDRLAARIFVKDIPTKAASAAIDADVTNLHAYQFHLNEVSGSKWTLSKFGFVYNSAN